MKTLETALIAAIAVLGCGAVTAQSAGAPAVRLLAPLQPGESSLDIELTAAELPLRVYLTHHRAGVGTPDLSHTIHSPVARLAIAHELVHGDSVSLSFDPSGKQIATYAHARQILGDVNLDQKVDMQDVDALLRHMFGLPGQVPVFELAADVDLSRSIDLNDVSVLSGHVMGGGPLPLLPTGREILPDACPAAVYVDELVQALGDQWNSMRANYAHSQLYHVGGDAVQPLVAVASRTQLSTPYIGRGGFAPRSSYQQDTRLVSAALLLVESIRRGHANSWLEAEFMNKEGICTDAELAQAVAVFSTWEALYSGVPVRSRPLPDVFGTSLDWPHDLFPQIPVGPGRLVPGTEGTVVWRYKIRPPVHCGVYPSFRKDFDCVVIDPGDPDAEFVGATPAYNCYAWALLCRRDVWAQPDTRSVDNMLREAGFDPTPKAAGAPVPAGSAAIAFTRDRFGRLVPAHALKRDANGKWSSQNGVSGGHYTDICDQDLQDFLDQHYPGTVEVRTYCRA